MRALHWGTGAVLILAGLAPARRVAAQTGFNGVITFISHKSDGTQSTFVQTTKGRKVRFDGFGGQEGTMIIDGDAKVMMIVQPEKKQYMTISEEDAKQMQAMMAPMMEKMKAKGMKNPHADAGKYHFEKTGRTEVVAGTRCEVWHGTYADADSTEEGEACMATGVGFALAELTYGNPMMQRGQAGWERFEQYRELTEGNKGLLKGTRIRDGKPSTDIEATKIERKLVDDGAFKPPAGFKEVRLADMMMQARNHMRQPPGTAAPEIQDTAQAQ